MDFEYTEVFYVSNEDLREMYLLCKNEEYTPQEAFDEVATRWDNETYCSADKVEDQIIAEIERRLAQSKN